ncbi:hypothetical protein Stok01_00516 [Sulfurisphaera tokodaii]
MSSKEEPHTMPNRPKFASVGPWLWGIRILIDIMASAYLIVLRGIEVIKNML